MGKGLLGLNPMHSDKFLFSNVSLAGLLTVLYAATDIKTFIAGKYHYMLYYLTLSIYPRMLITVSTFPINISILLIFPGKRELGTNQNPSESRPSSGHRRLGWQTQENHRLYHPRHARAHPARRESRTGHRRVSPGDHSARKFRDTKEEPQLRCRARPH